MGASILLIFGSHWGVVVYLGDLRFDDLCFSIYCTMKCYYCGQVTVEGRRVKCAGLLK